MSSFWTRFKETLCDHDDSVWSNLAYPAAALFAPTITAGLVVAVLGFNLAVMSGMYHHHYDDRAAKRDVWAMLAYVSGIASVPIAAFESIGSVSAYGVPLLAAIVYWNETPRNAARRDLHVGLWAVAGIVLAGLHAGWIVLLPAGVFACAVIVRRFLEGHSDSLVHSLWHVLGGVAAALLLFLL